MSTLIEDRGVCVRTADEHDVGAIRQLFLTTYGQCYPYRKFFDENWLLRSILGDDMVVLVAEEKATQRLLGTASIIIDVSAHSDLAGELGRLAVAHDARSRGLGHLLMEGRLRSIGDRLHVAFVENRTVHHHSQRVSIAAQFRPVGFLPNKHMVQSRESVGLYVRHFGPALSLRKNHPRIVPEVHRLASAALASLGMANDLIVDEVSPAYAARGSFVADTMTSAGLPALLRIERGRVHRREIFGPIRLHYGLFKLAVHHATYLLARDETAQGGAVAGGVGWVFDPIEQGARIFEVVARADETIRFLLEQAVARIEAEGAQYLEVDVSADAPRMQRTLVELGFVPAAYIPAMVFADVERLDIVRMVKLFGSADIAAPDLVPDARPFFDLIRDSLRQTHVLPEIQNAIFALPLFAGLDAGQSRRLAAAMRTGRIDEGATLFETGQPATALHVLLSGEVSIARGDRVLGIIGSGDVVGERGLLAGGQHRSTARARSELRVATLDAEALALLSRQRPDIALVLYRNLACGLGQKLDGANLGPHT